MKPVSPITIKGKLLLIVIRCFFLILSLFKGKKWKKPLPNFAENPANMGLWGGLYLGYKYYFKPPTHSHYNPSDYHLNPALPNEKINNKDLCISLGGDLMPYQRINNNNASSFWEFSGSFFNADIVFANLETPMYLAKSPSLVPEIMLNDMYFNGSKTQFEIFKNKHQKYNILSIANNHSFDQGKLGMNKTIDYLKQERIDYLGGRKTDNWEEGTCLKNIKGIKTGWFAITYSLNKITPTNNEKKHIDLVNINEKEPSIERAKILAESLVDRGADFLIASVHGGNAYQNVPSKHIIKNYHLLASQCGLDIIVAGHPHNPQPFEMFEYNYKGHIKQCFIIYSLGDFVADDIFDWARLPLTVKIWLTKNDTIRIKKVEIQAHILHSQSAHKLQLLPINLKGIYRGKQLTNKNQQQFLTHTFADFPIHKNFKN